MKLRRWQIRVARLLGTAALVAAIFWFIPISQVVASLRNLRPGYVAAGLAATVTIAYVQSVQLWLLLRSVGIPLSAWEVFQTNMITRFYGQVLPSELMAGAVKLYRLAGPGRQWGEVMAAQVCFRLLNTLVLVVLGLGFWLVERPAGTGRVVGPILAATAVAVLAAHLFFTREAPVRLARRLLPARGLAWLELPRFRRAREVLRSTSQSYRIFGGVTVPVAVIAVLRHLLGIVSFGLFARAVGVDLSYVSIGWIRVVLQGVMLLPITVSGLGLREGSLVLLLQQYAVPPGQAVALSLAVFASGVISNAIGGAFELVELHRPGRWGVTRSRAE